MFWVWVYLIRKSEIVFLIFCYKLSDNWTIGKLYGQEKEEDKEIIYPDDLTKHSRDKNTNLI